MSRSIWLVFLLAVGCGASSSIDPQDLGSEDAGFSATDAADSGGQDLGSPDQGSAGSDLGSADLGRGDLGSADLGVDMGTTDMGTPDFGQDAGASPDAGPPAGEVNLSFTGCQPEFGGDIIVSSNSASLSVGSLQGGLLQASLQFSLGSNRGAMTMSSQHRIDTGVVVNLVAPNTWSNLAQDPRAISGEIPDPISGTLNVRVYDRAAGLAEIDFMQVTLQNVVTDGLCTLNGTVRTTRLGR